MRLRPILDHSQHRQAIARRVVDALAARTDLRASLLTGSAAQGISDEHSDIDLINYYETLPDIATFEAAVTEAGATLKGPIGAPRPDGFVSRYDIDGIELQTGAALIAKEEARLERIAAGDVDWLVAKVAMGLREGVALYGEDVIARWMTRVAYTDSLRIREIQRNLGVFPIWRIDDHLAARDAELFRRQMLVEGAFRIIAVLSAVNRLYFSTFQFKRAGAHFDAMSIKPDRLSERIEIVANGDPTSAAEALWRLVDDTKAIVKAELPEMEVEVPWQPPAED